MLTRIISLFLTCVTLITFTGVLQAAADTEANKALVRRFEEAYNQGNLDVIDEICAPDYTWPMDNPQVRSSEEFKQHVAELRTMFPDIHLTFEDQVAEGDKVVSRWTIVLPTPQVTFTGILFGFFVDGKLAGDWESYDELGLMQQLGVPGHTMPGGPPFMDRQGEDFLWDPDSDVTGDPGDPEANEAIYQRAIEEVFVQGNVDAIDELVSTDFVNHDPLWPDVVDFESLKQWVTMTIVPVTDVQISIDDLITEGDKVASRWTCSMTDPATGIYVTTTGMEIIRVADGKIVEWWWAKDYLGMLQQLGVLPMPGPDPEANKELVRRSTEEVWNQKNPDAPDQFVAVDLVQHQPDGTVIEGIEAFKQGAIELFKGFPDLQLITEDAVAEGDKVTARLTFDFGAHQGEFAGIPATGISMTPYTGITTLRIADGKIAELWIMPDLLSHMQQLGAIPPMPEAGLPALVRQGEDFIWSQPSAATGDPGDPETNKAIVRRDVEEVWNQAKIEVVDEIYSPDFANHDPYWPAVQDLESLKGWLAENFELIPDGHVEILDMFAEGDKVVMHCIWSGTAGGQSLIARGISIYRMADGKIVDLWQAKSYLDMIQQMGLLGPPPPGTEEDFSNAFFMSLAPGLNMISLPLKPITPYTARSLAEEISATVVIKYDETRGRFVGFTMDAPGDGDFAIEGGKGYIVNVPGGGTVTFTGAAWTNEPPVEAAPPLADGHSAWAFVASGSALDSDGMSASDGSYTVTVKNLRTGGTASGTVHSSGYFAAAWADLSRNAVVEAGDRVEIAVMDSSGNIVSGPFVHAVTLDEIRNAVVNVHLRLGDIIPEKSALLQNYPNPFNPETWIPYHLKDAAPVSIGIYNAAGQLIRTLDLGHKDAGVYVSRSKAAYWDGKSEAGEKVASGIYFYTIAAGDLSATGKMVVKK